MHRYLMLYFTQSTKCTLKRHILALYGKGPDLSMSQQLAHADVHGRVGLDDRARRARRSCAYRAGCWSTATARSSPTTARGFDVKQLQVGSSLTCSRPRTTTSSTTSAGDGEEARGDALDCPRREAPGTSPRRDESPREVAVGTRLGAGAGVMGALFVTSMTTHRIHSSKLN